MTDFYTELHKRPLQAQLCVTPLASRSLIRIEGPDAEKFLQGQLTLDIATLESRGHSLGAHCNIKGHMISLMRLFRRSDTEFFASINAELVESALENLKRYSIFSKVTLTVQENWLGVGASAVNAHEISKALNLSDVNQPIQNAAASMIARISDDLYEIWFHESEADKVISASPDRHSDQNSWLRGLIEQGLPELFPATQTHFIPQMVNLQAVDGVSFSKGCYTGQEIVTRLQHRGILKKAMYRYNGATSRLPAPGEQIVNEEGATVAEVVCAARIDQATITLLAVVQQSQIEKGHSLSLDDGTALLLDKLPYTLDPRLFESKR